MGTVSVRIWNVTWRDGRPRFAPGPKARRRHRVKPFDLRHGPRDCPCASIPGAPPCPADNSWFTLDEAARWSAQKRLEWQDRKAARNAGQKYSAAKPRPAVTISDLFERWYGSAKFTGGVKQGMRDERGLSGKTIKGYKQAGKHLCAFDPDGQGVLGDEPPAAVSEVAAQAIYEKFWEQRGLYVARAIAAAASVCWGWAKRRGEAGVTRNPWADLDKQTPPPRLVVLDDFEVAAWVAACDLSIDNIARPEIGDAIMLGLFTGQRQGDRLALHDLGRDDKGRRLFKQSKTKAVVAVPETPQLRARLDASTVRRKRLALVDPHVVVNEQSGAPFKGDWYRAVIAERRALAVHGAVKIDGRVVSAKGLKGDNYDWVLRPCPSLLGKRDQDLRDTAVSWLGRAGCTIPEIAAITGHSTASIYTVLKHYLALHPDMADAAIGKLVKWMEEQGIAV